MKTAILKLVEVDVKAIKISVKPRYIGDSEDDDMANDFPLLKDGIWEIVVDVDAGRIRGWPNGVSRELYVKVCDAGQYTLLNPDNEVIASIDGYVPNGIVPGEDGDYIAMTIDGDGIITNWPDQPDISAFNYED